MYFKEDKRHFSIRIPFFIKSCGAPLEAHMHRHTVHCIHLLLSPLSSRNSHLSHQVPLICTLSYKPQHLQIYPQCSYHQRWHTTWLYTWFVRRFGLFFSLLVTFTSKTHKRDLIKTLRRKAWPSCWFANWGPLCGHFGTCWAQLEEV